VNPAAPTEIGIAAHLDPTDGGYKMSVTIDPRNLTLEPLVVVGKAEQLTTVPSELHRARFSAHSEPRAAARRTGKNSTSARVERLGIS
jgi:hypothetical protein